MVKRVHNPVTHKYYSQRKEKGRRGQFSGLWHPPKRRPRKS